MQLLFLRLRRGLHLQHLADALGRHLGVGVHDDGKGRHDHPVHNQGDVLNYSENVAAAGRAKAPLHAKAAQIHDQHHGHIHQRNGQGRDNTHAHVGTDDVFRHDLCGVLNAFVLPRLAVEGPDDPDAV